MNKVQPIMNAETKKTIFQKVLPSLFMVGVLVFSSVVAYDYIGQNRQSFGVAFERLSNSISNDIRRPLGD